MWGVGEGRWDRQHFFTMDAKSVADQMWTSLCGAWQRREPVAAPTRRHCAVCELRKRDMK